jgi:hypothetical protein
MLMRRVARGMAALVDGCAWDGSRDCHARRCVCREPACFDGCSGSGLEAGWKAKNGASPAIEAQIPGLRRERWWGAEGAKQILLLGVDWRWVQVIDRGVHG